MNSNTKKQSQRKDGFKVNRKMGRLFRNIQKKRSDARKETKKLVKKEKHEKEQFIKTNKPFLSKPYSSSSKRFEMVKKNKNSRNFIPNNEKKKGKKKKSKVVPYYHRPEDLPQHRINKYEQNVTKYRNVKYGRNVENIAMEHLNKNKFEAEMSLGEKELFFDSNYMNQNHFENEGFIELDENDPFLETKDLKQKDILQTLSQEEDRKKVFDLSLPGQMGYHMQYTQSGRNILFGGLAGHLFCYDWKTHQKKFEIMNVGHRIDAIQWMMDDSFFAVAGRKWETRVYDDEGAKIHCIHDFRNVKTLEYLPYHFLLVGGEIETGRVHYLDISLGKTVSSLKMNPFLCLTKNHSNGLICTGHRDGTVSFLSPRDDRKKPSLSMFCHEAPVSHICVSTKTNGNLMVTYGMDYSFKVWDLRKTFSCISERRKKSGHSFECMRHPSVMKLSGNDMLAVGYSNSCQVKIFKNISSLNTEKVYLKSEEMIGNSKGCHPSIISLDFCPYEDVLGIGWSGGFRSMIVPGAYGSEDLIDSRNPNPFFQEKQLKNWNVDRLIEKVPWETICLAPSLIGSSGEEMGKLKFNLKGNRGTEVKKQIQNLNFRVKETEKGKKKEGEIKQFFFNLRRDERRKMMKQEEEEIQKREGKVKLKKWYEESNPNPFERFLGKQERIEREKGKMKQNKIKELKRKREESFKEDVDEDEEERITKKRKLS